MSKLAAIVSALVRTSVFFSARARSRRLMASGTVSASNTATTT